MLQMSKLVNSSRYNAKKKQFIISFKDRATAKLVKLLMDSPKGMANVVVIPVTASTSKETMMKLLELSSMAN